MNQAQRQTIFVELLSEVEALVNRYPRLVHTWRFATSAVWALDHYYAAHAQAKSGTIREDNYVRDTKDNIGKLVQRQAVSLDWERGFWYNAAIMRFDALWERIFKLFLPPGVKFGGPRLYLFVEERRATQDRPKYEESSFGRIRQIVNQLKHEPGGAKPDIREIPELPLQVMRDLLAVLKDPHLQVDLVPFKQGHVLAGRSKGVRRGVV